MRTFGRQQQPSSPTPTSTATKKPPSANNNNAAAPTQIHPPGTTAAFVVQDHSWIIGEILNYNQTTKTYTCQSKDPIVKADKVAAKDVWAPRVEYLDEDVDDLLMLTELHEASILFCLKKRYMRDVVYTNIGPIVVALNPFTFDIPWYKDEKMKDYLNEGVVVERNLPHTWAVAHNTYWEMRENRMNQTILISGESGAGKTEAAKIVVKYIGILSTLQGTKEQKAAISLINQKVVAASPILESFGNAKTVRNDNSSRFGKFMQLQFDTDGFLCGSFAIKYLLEKSRIIGSAQDERVYHSFYQLAVGDDHKLYGIGKNKKAYKMLDMGNCLTVDSIDDSADFVACKNSMALVGINDTEQTSIWKIVAGILSFQNVQFVEHEEKGNKVASVDEDYEAALSRACEHWSIVVADCQRELCTSTRVARNEKVMVLLDKVKALDTRDSCSKGLYDALFDWLVEKINTTTDFKNSDEAKTGARTIAHWIGLLDIFGFEDFVLNSFEQICINLANETLQNHYNTFIFKEDLRECEEEGLDVRHVTFEDNRGCLELLSLDRISVFSMLDEECKVSGTNKNFMDKLLQHFAQTKEKAGSKYFVTVQGKQKDNCFRIKHYAGDVTYTVDGWLEKNRDTFKDDMKSIFHRSTDPFVAALVPPVEDSSKPTTKLTVSAFFARQLQELMGLINSTNPHWIRCIKPHPAKQPRMFSHVSVMAQLRSAGVLETVKVRQGGYPIRFTQELFTIRYKILCDQFKDTATTAQEKCKALFDKLELAKEIAQLGKTKVFLRNAAFVKLNRAKDEATEVHSLDFQRIARAFTVRAGLFKHYVRMHRDRLLAEKKAREEAVRRMKEEQARKERLEREAREKREALERATKTTATIKIQRVARRFVAYRQLRRCFLETKRNKDDIMTINLHDSWRGLTVMDLADHRVGIQEQLIRDRKSRTAAELAAAAVAKNNNNSTNNKNENETTQQLLERMEQRRREMAQQKRERISQIQKKNADSDALFEKKLQAARERQKLQLQTTGGNRYRGGASSSTPGGTSSSNKTRLVDTKNKIVGDDEDADHNDMVDEKNNDGENNNNNNDGDSKNATMKAKTNNNDPSSLMRQQQERLQKREMLLDAEIARKVEAARQRQDAKTMHTMHMQEQMMKEEMAMMQMQQQQSTPLQKSLVHNQKDDATRVVFQNVRDSWSRQQQWSKVRQDAFMQDRQAAKQENERTIKKELLLTASSNFRITTPSPFLSPIYNVLEDEERHRDPYSGNPTRLTSEQLRREAIFQLQQQRKNNNEASPTNSSTTPARNITQNTTSTPQSSAATTRRTTTPGSGGRSAAAYYFSQYRQ